MKQNYDDEAKLIRSLRKCDKRQTPGNNAKIARSGTIVVGFYSQSLHNPRVSRRFYASPWACPSLRRLATTSADAISPPSSLPIKTTTKSHVVETRMYQ